MCMDVCILATIKWLAMCNVHACMYFGNDKVACNVQCACMYDYFHRESALDYLQNVSYTKRFQEYDLFY